MTFYENGFNIFGLDVKYYGILMAVGFIVGLIFAIKFAKQKGYKSSLPYDLLLIVFPSAIIGARLCYVLFNWGDGWTFLEILQIWNGGLMIYGGVLFAVGAIGIYCAVKKINFVKILDMLAPCLIIGQAIGRWGNYFNQEAYGSLITNPSFQWFPFGVYIDRGNFTSEAYQQVIKAFGTADVAGAWFNATFFYESMWCLIGFILLYFIYTKTNKVGLTTASYFVFYGIERFLVEMIRTDSLYLGPIKISVLISSILVVSGIIWMIVILIKNKSKKLSNAGVAVEITSGQSLSLEDLEELDGMKQAQKSIQEQKEKIVKEEQRGLMNLYNKLEEKERIETNTKSEEMQNIDQLHQSELVQEIGKQHDLPTNMELKNWTEIIEDKETKQESPKASPKVNPEVANLKNDEVWSDDSIKDILNRLSNYKNSDDNK